MIFLYYIQESDKPRLVFKLFNIIQLEGDKIILPIEGTQIDNKKAEKLAQKTKKIFEKAKSKKVIISKKIQKQEQYVNQLYRYPLEMVEGRWLFEVLSSKILDYILLKKQKKKEETQITILVNDLSENMLCQIRNMVKQYKIVNIITNHKEKFKKLEKQILEEDGIMITVGNNKKKGLAKAELILNIDFPSEWINRYTIYEEAIIVNVREGVKIENKRFNGITINDYEIEVQNEESFDYDKKTKYRACQIYEAQMNKRQPFKEIMKQMEQDKVKIVKLITANSVY